MKQRTLDGKRYVDAKMPMIGLGMWKIGEDGVDKKKAVEDVLNWALAAGYRSFDTAQLYGNEALIGEALKDLLPKHNLTREDIFITTKIKPANMGSKRCKESIFASLTALQVDYIDLLLIHWPGGVLSNISEEAKKHLPANWNHKEEYVSSESDSRNRVLRHESWRVMEELYGEGKVRALGVSNFQVKHLEELRAIAHIPPVVNQCECHPHFFQRELVAYCRAADIRFQAYSSLDTHLLKDPNCRMMAKKYGISVSTFLLAWALNQGIPVLPRSTKKAHIEENFRATDVKIAKKDIEDVMWEPSLMTMYRWSGTDPNLIV